MTQPTLTRADGSTLTLTPEQRASFWRRIEPGARGCKDWTGFVSQNGYGLWSIGLGAGRTTSIRPHRVAYELLIGPIPDGLEIDHLCRNKRCCNVAHLEAVTREENMRRSMPYRRPPKNRNRGASIVERERVDGSISYRVHYRLDGKQRVITYDTRADAERFVATARTLGVKVALAEHSYAEVR